MPAACADVRDRLPEHALGVLSETDRRAVEGHLERCAACRKEAGELAEAATTLAFSLRGTNAPDGLLPAVVATVGRAARAPAFRRRTRAAAVVAVAATLALAATSFGAVMAGRAQRYEVLAQRQQQQQVAALRRFQVVIDQLQGELGTGLRSDQTRLVRLAPPSGGVGGGAALQLVSRDMLDFVMLHVSGLSADRASLPYTVWVVDGQGHALRAGRLTTLDANHGGEVFAQFRADLAPYSKIVVRDASGRVALEGVADRSST
jgi:hypothetical protein